MYTKLNSKFPLNKLTLQISLLSCSNSFFQISPKAWDLLEQKLFSYNILENGYVEVMI